MRKTTRKKLSQYFFLDRELKAWERQLNELIHQPQVKAQSIDGMPFQNTGEASDKVADIAIKIIELTETINAFKYNLSELKLEIEKYIMDLDDPILRQIIIYRCIELRSWESVAALIGGKNTADGCRMYYNRKIPKE